LNFKGASTFRGNFIASVIFVAITSRMPTASRTFPKFSYTWSSTTMTWIPASASWCSSSRCV
jgi:hypothetical protein